MRARLKHLSTSFDGMAHLDWHFMEVGKQAYHAGWGWWMQVRSVPCNQKFSCKWNLSFCKTVRPNTLLFYLGIPLHIISPLFSYFCLFQSAILYKMIMLGFWSFKPIFLRMQLSLFATFFSLVLVICLIWYFHLYIIYYLEIILGLHV